MENRLVSASGVKNAALKYDPKGRLFEITSAGITTQFLYDGDALVAEYNTSGILLNRYVHGSRVDEPYLWYANNGVNASHAATYTSTTKDPLSPAVANAEGADTSSNENVNSTVEPSLPSCVGVDNSSCN